MSWDDIAHKPMQCPPKKQRGRPVVPAEQRRDRTVRARVTAEEEAKFVRLGGAEWVRAALKRARET